VGRQHRVPAALIGTFSSEGSGRRLVVYDLEDDNDLQDAVLTVHHRDHASFNLTGAVKIVENHLGKAWVKTGQIQIAAPPSPPASGPPSPPV
jgi:hypothetical protein